MNFEAASAVLAFPRIMPAQRKLLAALLFSLCAASLAHPYPACAAAFFAFLLLPFSGLEARFIRRRLRAINLFLLPLWLLLPLSFSPLSPPVPDETILPLGPLFILPSRFATALLITLKGNAIAAALLALTGSSSPAENNRALRSLHVPDKMIALLIIIQTNLELMSRESAQVFQAARLRGFVPRSSPASWRIYARLIGLLLLRSWQRARRVEQAMLLRGFAGAFPSFPQSGTECRTDANACSGAFRVCCLTALLLAVWDFMI
ncbi:MAG: cobalt ECF transporter T component CbiQ [Desulfovibrio sp.]|nr:cobalt ECF transporter T component CbiQ [Desulfovibrio sp.]